MKSLFEPVVGCFENVKELRLERNGGTNHLNFLLLICFSVNYFATFVVINQSINQLIDDGDAF